MAYIHIDHTPQTTQVCQALNLIVPDPGSINNVPVSQRKVLYLLHGLSDDGSAWQRYSSIEAVANAYGLVVVMPSVARSFYTDLPNGQKFFSYIVEELPRYLAEVFNLRPKREDTYMAGLSMGGYGAMKCALLHPELYGAVASFSGVLSMVGFAAATVTDQRYSEFSLIFGDLLKVPGSEYDPAVWLKNAAAHVQDLPKLFVSCGRQDDLYPLNQLFVAGCKQLNVPVNYYEEDGKHDWFFWDREIKRFLTLVLGERL